VGAKAFKTTLRGGGKLSGMDNPILRFLPADGPHPDLDPNADLYGGFVGSWDIDNHQYDESRGEWVDSRGECHFGWILEGRAIQDLWGSPRRGFGTTIRSYDPSIDAWRIHWFAPAWTSYCTLIGRADGNRIMQEGEQSDGRLIRWSFNDITPDSFLWRGEISDDSGATWRLEQEMHARRRT
jgi:hypothetical protein